MRLPFTFERRSVAEAREAEREALFSSLSKKVETLESLLSDVGFADPDSALPGYSNAALYRELGVQDAMGAARDLPFAKRREIQRLSHLTYALRGDGSNLISIILDFTFGENGVRPVAVNRENKALQSALDEIWNDPENKLAANQRKMALSLLLDGERFGPAEMIAEDGRLELGFFAPETVESVEKDVRFRDAFLLRTNPRSGGDPLRFFILDSLSDSIEIDPIGGEEGARYRVRDTRTGTSRDVHGLAFAWFWDRPEGAFRGRPENQAVLDFIDVHDEHLWASVEREKLLKLLLVHVQDPSVNNEATAKDILRKIGLLSPPEGRRVIATGDNTKIDVLGAPSTAQPMESLERLLGLNVYGAKGLPETFRGSGSDSNLATAQAMEIVPSKRLASKQGEILGLFRRLVEVSLELRIRAGSFPAMADRAFVMERPEIAQKDRSRGAKVVSDLGSALDQAVSAGALRREAQNAVLVQAIRDAGFDLSDEVAKMPSDEEVAKEFERRLAAARSAMGDDDGDDGGDEDDDGKADGERGARGSRDRGDRE